MVAWNMNYTPDLISVMAQSVYSTGLGVSSNLASSGRVTGTSSEYAKILAEQISKLNGDLQTAIDQQKESLSQSQMPVEIETVKRFRPDGSIMIMTYEDGELTSTVKKKPHLVPVQDVDAPPNPDSGKLPIKLEPRFSITELLF